MRPTPCPTAARSTRARVLGIRVQAQVAEAWTVLAGAFNGDPSGPERVDGRRSNRSGSAFRLGDGVFAIAEVQYGLNRGETAAGLPGTYKFGGWYNSRRFDDRRTGADGFALGDPASNGQPASRRGNWSIYAVVDLTAEPATVQELDRQLNLNEGVLRTKVLRPEHR